MNSKYVIVNAKIAGSLAAALTMIAAPVFAGPKPPQPTMDKCYGIALKGDNDCAAGAGTTFREGPSGTKLVIGEPGARREAVDADRSPPARRRTSPQAFVRGNAGETRSRTRMLSPTITFNPPGYYCLVNAPTAFV